MNTHDFDISVLIPTRARTDMLFRSIQTLFDLADNKDRINLVIGFDRDDAKGIECCSFGRLLGLDELEGRRMRSEGRTQPRLSPPRRAPVGDLILIETVCGLTCLSCESLEILFSRDAAATAFSMDR